MFLPITPAALSSAGLKPPKVLATAVAVLVCLGAPGTALGQCLGRPASLLLPPGLKLTIRAEKPVAEISRPVVVSIELSNETRAPITIWDRLAPELDYELHVRDENGKEPPLAPFGKQIRPYRGGSRMSVVLAPGERYTDKEDLSKVYAISVPGSYAVEACRDIIEWGNIYSNKITIPFVVPPQAAK